MPRPLAVLGITYFFCLAVLLNLSVTVAVIMLCIAASCLVVTLIIKTTRETAVFPTAFFAILLASIMTILTGNYYFEPAKNLIGEDVSIHAQIVDLPYEYNGKFYYTLKTIESGGEEGGIKLRLSCKTPLDAEPYDCVDFVGTVYALGGDDKDIRNYYLSSGVSVGAYTFQDIVVSEAQSRPPFFYILKLRAAIKSTVNSYLPNENGGLITALLLGDTSGLSYETKQAFSNTGVAHIFSVSGLHMSVWVMSVLALLEALKVKRKAAALISIAFLFLLFGLTGFSTTCMRSGFMYLLMLVGYIVRRKADPLNSLGFAVFVITIISPYAAISVGLQLSFLSTLGIITMYSPISKPVFRRINIIGFRFPRSLLKAIAGSVCVTIPAVVFTMPVIIYVFGSVSLIAPLSNLMINYSCSVAMITGGLAAIISLFGFLSFVSYPLMFIAGIMSKFSLWCVRYLNNFSFASVSAGEKYIIIWLAGSLLLFAYAAVVYRSEGKWVLRMTSIFCIISLLAGLLSYNVFNSGVTKITVVDTGNGTCILVTKNSHAFMIGCGGDYFASNNAIEAFDNNSVESLDVMLIPRLKDTEYNAVEDVIKQINAKCYVAPLMDNILSFYDRTRNFLVTQNAEINLWDVLDCHYEYGDDCCYTYLDIDGTTILCIFNAGCDVSLIPQQYRAADILISRSEPPVELAVSGFSLVVISADAQKSVDVLQNQRMSGVYAAATAGLGNIVIRTSGNSIFSVGRQG